MPTLLFWLLKSSPSTTSRSFPLHTRNISTKTLCMSDASASSSTSYESCAFSPWGSGTTALRPKLRRELMKFERSGVPRLPLGILALRMPWPLSSMKRP